MSAKTTGRKPGTKARKSRVAAKTGASRSDAGKQNPASAPSARGGKRAGQRRTKSRQASSAKVASPRASTRDSKQSRLIAMLRAASGATIAQMIALTGWQAHTIRGAISGALRKKLGLNVVSERPNDSERRYRIVGSPVRM